MNFRSCSGEPNRLERSYHGGDTSDLAWVIQRLTAHDPQQMICCVGVSLGGNVLLKYLGEQGAAAPPNLKAAVAISAPFDLAASARAFEQDAWNQMYMRRLVRSLKQKTMTKLTRYPALVDRRRLAGIETIAEFDEAVTAPVYGFASAESYWAAASCSPFLSSIRRPTLLINAKDDPLIPLRVLPTTSVVQNPFLAAEVPAGGGHAGFISGSLPIRPMFWAEEQALAFCRRHAARLENSVE
jgi:predicted alpha/beta-fold hydrolase